MSREDLVAKLEVASEQFIECLDILDAWHTHIPGLDIDDYEEFCLPLHELSLNRNIKKHQKKLRIRRENAEYILVVFEKSLHLEAQIDHMNDELRKMDEKLYI